MSAFTFEHRIRARVYLHRDVLKYAVQFFEKNPEKEWCEAIRFNIVQEATPLKEKWEWHGEETESEVLNFGSVKVVVLDYV